MRRHLIHLTVASVLALGAACRDAAAPEQASSVGPAVAADTSSTRQTPSPTPNDTVWLNFGGPGLLAGDSLVLRGQVRRGAAEAPDTLAWETSDASVAS